MTLVVVTPSKNGTTFQSDGVFVTARDSGNAARSRSRNGALTLDVAPPSQNFAIFKSDGVELPPAIAETPLLAEAGIVH